MGKTIVITGTRKGIGKELCRYYLSQGHVVAGCSRKESSISHDNYYHYTVDVADEKPVVQMISDVRRRFGRIDVLLNNAGIAAMNHILTTPFKTVDNVFRTNVFGTFLFLREAAKVMIKQKQGRIVNFATVAAPLRLEGEAVYAASKAAVVTLTEIASRELGQFNITVNAVGPSPIKTDLIKNVPKNKLDALLERQAIKRFGEMQDIINVIDFFIDEKSDYITGQTIYLGGVHSL
jgi:3-oxoacyl-[acyl-carrier protein] reductase